MKNCNTKFRVIRIFLFLLFPQILLSQSTYEGFVICMDNLDDGDKNLNQYYYVPFDFLNNNEAFTKESLEYKGDKLEEKIRTVGGLKIYKEIDFNCSRQENFEVTEEDYKLLTFGLFYFHYFDNESFPQINKAFFLKKIKHNKYYVAKIRFKGIEQIDRDYLYSKIFKMFVCKIDDIKMVDDIERKQLIKLIEGAY
jgi:hypothetical protein